jgi:uncharacterized protein
MLIVLSPAKSLNENAVNFPTQTLPRFLAKSQKLVNQLSKLSPKELSDLMNISSKLAELNFLRFQKWKLPFTSENAKTAILTFDGDVYNGMDARSFSPEEMLFAQDTLHILSGLYGILRPLDLIQPYRLEMGIRLKQDKSKNLYEFWGSQLTEAINQSAIEKGKNVLINLASDEYFKAIDVKKLKIPTITPIFKQEDNGKYRFVSFYAKRARGLMSRFIIKHHISNPEDIKGFDYEGYNYNAALSSGNIWAFTR